MESEAEPKKEELREVVPAEIKAGSYTIHSADA